MKKTILNHLWLAVLLLVLSGCVPGKDNPKVKSPKNVWTIAKADGWSKRQPWFRGSNFNPSTAVNQLETWQAETFDPITIERELGWAQGIGFNCMRVYLHHLAWQVDRKGFKNRMDKYLSIADSYGIKTIFVFFDDCWNENYSAGPQPAPKVGIHNSGWVRDPGKKLADNPGLIDTLEIYVKDILTTFSKDRRIVLWDLYNEPGNNNLGNKSMTLLEAVFKWAREVGPSQPVSVGIWNKELKDLNLFQLENSDIITYHNYADEKDHKAAIDSLKKYNRPLICTEYMARPKSSKFENILPLLENEGIGAINWGLVAGKTNTMYAWEKPMPDGKEPEVWFHDIFRPDGTAYDPAEIDLIRKITGAAR